MIVRDGTPRHDFFTKSCRCWDHLLTGVSLCHRTSPCRCSSRSQLSSPLNSLNARRHPDGDADTHAERFLSSPKFAFVGLAGGDGRIVRLRITTEIGHKTLVASPAFAGDPFLLELFRTRNPQKAGGRVAPGRCHPETGTVRIGVRFQPGRGEGEPFHIKDFIRSQSSATRALRSIALVPASSRSWYGPSCRTRG